MVFPMPICNVKSCAQQINQEFYVLDHEWRSEPISLSISVLVITGKEFQVETRLQGNERFIDEKESHSLFN